MIISKRKLKISQQEFDLLETYLNDPQKKLTKFNREKLLEELKNSKVLDEDKLPEDVIRLNSIIELKEIKTEKKFNFQLVQPSLADFKNNKISILAPISIALIGYSTGAVVDWEMPDGAKQYKIISVTNFK